MENFIEMKDADCELILFFREKEEDASDDNSPILSPNEV